MKDRVVDEPDGGIFRARRDAFDTQQIEREHLGQRRRNRAVFGFDDHRQVVDVGQRAGHGLAAKSAEFIRRQDAEGNDKKQAGGES